MDSVHQTKYSLEEYIALEQETDTRYEYHDGEVFAMAGGTLNHSILGANIITELNINLEGSNCIVLNGDAKLSIAKYNKYLYPDTMVVRGKIEHSTQYKEAVTNPVVIVEVLSDSTGEYDRGDKFKYYRSISSLQEYILISQDKHQVDIFTRKGDFWRIDTLEDLKQTLVLISLGIEIPLQRIYRNVGFGEMN